MGSIRFFIATVNKKKVGVVGYDPYNDWLAENRYTIVKDEYRGKGYGKQIAKLMEIKLKEKGYGKLMTRVYTDNIRMVCLRLKDGYVVEGIHFDHDGPDLSEYTMGKLI